MEKLQEFIEKVQQDPLYLLSSPSEPIQKDTLKAIHDALIISSQTLQKQKNEKLITKGTDLDQIWEQLKLHLDPIQKNRKIPKLYEKIQTYKIHQEGQNGDEGDSFDNDDDNNDDYDDDGEQSDDDDEFFDVKKKNGKKQKNAYDDINQETQEDSENLEDLENMSGEQLDEEEGEDGEDIDEEELNAEGEEEGYDQLDEKAKNEENDELQKFLEQADHEDMNFEETKRKFAKGELNQDIEDDEDLGSEYEFGSEGDYNSEEKEFFDTTQGNFPKSSKVSKSEAEDFFGKLKNGKNQMDFEEDEDDEEGEEGEELDDNEVEDDIFDEQRENAMMELNEENEKIHNEDEIQRLENQLIGDNIWQVKGEVKSNLRPVNSLVNETLDFKNNKKQIENITQEYSEKLEDIIKQRILDEAFDDRQRIVNSAFIKENFTAFSKEKSDKGLAELYEDEFKSQLNLTTVSKEDKLKQEILELFKETCYKLDCLTNLSFTPKPFVKDAEIQASNLKLNIDEKIPLGHLQGSKTLQQNERELLDKKKDAKFLSKEEMSHSEKQTERARNKKVGRVRQKEKDRKKMLKNLEFTGQTKHEYNLLQEAKKEGKKIAKNKQQLSVKFNKSGQFFTSLQETLNNPDSNNKKAIMEQRSKKIKKNQQKL